MPRVETKRQIYRLTEADYQIIEQGRKDPNYITDYFLRSPTSGTYWRHKPTTPDPLKIATWEFLHKEWVGQGAPRSLMAFQDIDYEILWDEEQFPIFWHHHGWLWQNWQKEWFLCGQPEITVIGGFASGKTAAEAAILCTLAMITPNFRGFAVAPQMLQSMEIYRYIMTNFQSSPWFKNFVWNYPKKPYPMFTLKSDYIGESSIEILSIEKDPEKVRTLEGDYAMLDQAEKIQELDEIIKDLGTRSRGMVSGREKLGKLALVANSDDNPQLWQRFDLAQWEPEVYKSFEVSAYDNIYLSARDISNLERRVGGTKEKVDQWLKARRPSGKGEHFPVDMVMAGIDHGLDNIMDKALENIADIQQKGYEVPLDRYEYAFYKKSDPKVGTYLWEMPPDHKAKRQYVVIADPGQGNPPDRNSACVMVWDISDFPDGPVVLRAFNWVYGNGSYWPFLTEFQRYVGLFRAQGQCAFDSTGVQKGFDELVMAMMKLRAEGLDMAGNRKYLALNAAKLFMGKGLMRYPYISRLCNQLTNYKLPDTKIQQDLVMTLCMSALYIRRFYWEELDDEDVVTVQTRRDRRPRPVKNRNTRRHRFDASKDRFGPQ